MSIINKILKSSLLILIAFTLLVPTSAYSQGGSPAEKSDHSEHTQQSVAAYEPNDCASACAQISRTANPAVTLKQSKSSKQQQSKTECESVGISKEHIEPRFQNVPEPFILPIKEIYKFTCAYLF